MKRRTLWAFMAFLLLMPASFGGFTITCTRQEDQGIGDAFDNLINAIKDAF